MQRELHDHLCKFLLILIWYTIRAQRTSVFLSNRILL